ncbi:hypothetical protein HanLR1_Chr12g0430201 [Helianthus annuus]|nr:hypothetical protein HanLR1_Chr12g0430201 [Helianthus annuus]
MNEITSNTVRQSPIQEPKEGSKDTSFEYGKDHVLTAMNYDHDQYNKPPVISSDRDQCNERLVISSKKLCLSSKNVQHEVLDSTVIHDLDAQKENLLNDQKKSFDGTGLTNPKRKKLGLTGKKPSIPFLGIPQNRKNDDKVSTPVSKLPRKPLQTLEGKHNRNMYLRVDDEVSDTNVSKNDEETLEQGLCEAEGVIVLDSEDSEEEKPVASKPRRLIARKRVLGKY